MEHGEQQMIDLFTFTEMVKLHGFWFLIIFADNSKQFNLIIAVTSHWRHGV